MRFVHLNLIIGSSKYINRLKRVLPFRQLILYDFLNYNFNYTFIYFPETKNC